MGDILIALTVFAIIITMITAVGTIVAYFSAAQRARDAARQWMDEHAESLTTILSKIESRAREAARLAEAAELRAEEADRMTTETRVTLEAAKTKSEGYIRELEEARVRVQARLDTSISFPPVQELGDQKGTEAQLSEAQRGALVEADQMLREKPEAQYSANDWENRALAAYDEHDLEAAATYFRKTALAEDARPQNTVRSRLNRGIVLEELGRTTEALEVYDAVLSRYKDETNDEVRNMVARAQLNKGLALSKLNRFDDAIRTSDQFVTQYKSNTEPTMRELVVRALLSKTYVLGRLERWADGLQLSNEVIAHYSNDASIRMQENVTRAVSDRAFFLGRLGQFEDSIGVYEELASRFSHATNVSMRRILANAMVNASAFLIRRGDYERGITFAENGILFATSDGINLPKFEVMATGNRAEALARVGRYDEALSSLENALEHYNNSSDKGVQKRLVGVELIRALILGWNKRIDAARLALDALIARHAGSPDEQVRDLVAKASKYKATPATEWDTPKLTWND